MVSAGGDRRAEVEPVDRVDNSSTGRASTPSRVAYVGRYRELGHGLPDGPSIHEASPLDPAVKGAVLAYLEQAPVVAASAAQATDVVTGEPACPLDLQTDGTWAWYRDTAHYVRAYDSPLPADFVATASRGQPVHLDHDRLMAVATQLRGF